MRAHRQIGHAGGIDVICGDVVGITLGNKAAHRLRANVCAGELAVEAICRVKKSIMTRAIKQVSKSGKAPNYLRFRRIRGHINLDAEPRNKTRLHHPAV